MKKLKLIAAISLNHAIGLKGKVPWQNREDLLRFKQLTSGGAVIMGNNTFVSDLECKALPNRKNIVLCHSPLPSEIVTRVEGVDTAIEASGDLDTWVIGGRTIYELFLPIVDELYITHIHKIVDADTYFPNIDWANWIPLEVIQHPAHSFVTYQRR